MNPATCTRRAIASGQCESSNRFRIEWFRLGEQPTQARIIDMEDVRALPFTREGETPLRIGQESVRVAAGPE